MSIAMNLEGNLILYQFSKKVAVGLPLEPMNFPMMAGFTVSVPVYIHSIYLLWSNSKVVGCFHNLWATVAPLCLSRHFSHYCSSQGSQLCKALLVSPTAAYRAPSVTRRASKQVGTTWFLHVLRPTCVICSAIGSYYHVLVGNIEQCR